MEKAGAIHPLHHSRPRQLRCHGALSAAQCHVFILVFVVCVSFFFFLLEQELLAAVEKVGGIYCITADHGNCDDMAQRNKKTGEPLKGPDGQVEPLTSHTLNPVGAHWVLLWGTLALLLWGTLALLLW